LGIRYVEELPQDLGELIKRVTYIEDELITLQENKPTMEGLEEEKHENRSLSDGGDEISNQDGQDLCIPGLG
jgi:hypothetical protein